MVVDLVIRKTNSSNPNKKFALTVRNYNGIEVEWITLCYMDAYSAHSLIGETVSAWDKEADENDPETESLRLEHPTLRKAWDQYQTLKLLYTKPSK